jgi:hypothetical protein
VASERRPVSAGESGGKLPDAADAANREAGGMARTARAGGNPLPGVTDSRRVTAIDARPTSRWRNVGSVAA